MNYLLVIDGGQSWAGRPASRSVHESEDEANAVLDEYVREKWDAEMNGEPMPEEAEDRIAAYFEDSNERYEIHPFVMPQGGEEMALHLKERT